MDKPKMQTLDIVEDNIEKIAEIFPNCITETQNEDGEITRAIDFDLLRQELSGVIVEGPEERYQLNWPGKRQSLLTANAPILKTLRPVPEESVDFENTKNIFIEGDNLDALKLLQESYLGKVKMIYIDPPYNTGNDFIYEDDFAVNKDEYLAQSGQIDEEGNKLKSNPETNGRFHSVWLSMMYPRLKLARKLLRDDGVIFISIDDNEAASLKRLCDEVFGIEKFLTQLVWKSRQNKDNRNVTGASTDHEYILCYGNNLRGSERDLTQYTNPDNDERGDWASANMVGMLGADLRPNCHFDLINPETKINYGKPKMGWRYDQSTMNRLIAEKKILWPANIDGRPRRKLFLSELQFEYNGLSSIFGADIYTRNGTAEIESLFNWRAFDFPKPTLLIKQALIQGINNDRNAIILDFFAGSATTAHAVMQLNAEDGGNRQFILVQLPEECDPKSEAFKAGYKNIAEISKERIRRAGQKIKDENPLTTQNLDIGFRVLKVDTTNMEDVYYTPEQTTQGDLLKRVDNIKEGRTDLDLLFQILVDWAIPLDQKIIQKEVNGCKFYLVNQDPIDLLACFDKNIDDEITKQLAALKPARAIFRDGSFKSPDTKINATQYFKQLSPNTEVKFL